MTENQDNARHQQECGHEHSDHTQPAKPTVEQPETQTGDHDTKGTQEKGWPIVVGGT